MPIGASQISRPTASPRKKSRACAPKKRTPRRPLVDRYHLCFALGKAFEDRGEYEESFRYYQQGNAYKREESRYRPEIIEANTRKTNRGLHVRVLREASAVWDRPSADPIFIVGLPRSGSTLLEQILASHSRVEGTQELADIPRLVLELQGRDPDLDNPRYPGVFTTHGPGGVPAVGREISLRTRACTAKASRTSSTRCRTTSATSA